MNASDADMTPKRKIGVKGFDGIGLIGVRAAESARQIIEGNGIVPIFGHAHLKVANGDTKLLGALRTMFERGNGCANGVGVTDKGSQAIGAIEDNAAREVTIRAVEFVDFGELDFTGVRVGFFINDDGMAISIEVGTIDLGFHGNRRARQPVRPTSAR